MASLTAPKISPRAQKILKTVGIVVLTLIVLLALFVIVFDWNWLRGPIERRATEKSGRALVIGGDFKVKLGWPDARLQADNVTFANPDWAKEKQMISVEKVELTLNLPQLFRKKIVMPEVRLGKAVVFLEQHPDGRKNWLLDRQQKDESASADIDVLLVDEGRLSYDDPAQKTHIESNLSTGASTAANKSAGLNFSAKGTYHGMAMNAQGSSGAILALRDKNIPYPLKIDGNIGRTSLHADGTVTSLTQFSAIDMQISVRGESLGQLFPLLGVTLPETPPYTTKGHLVRNAKVWRYEKFTAKIGQSDMAGTLQVDTAGQRPFMKGEIVFQVLNFADLGPVIGAKKGKLAAARQSPAVARVRVLPDLPFRTERWRSMDADVKLSAKTIRRAEALPLDNFVTHLKLNDAVMTLDPLNFGFAGGQLVNVVKLDGRQDPIHAKIKIQARKLKLNQLFPTFELNKASIGQINGIFDLEGRGNSVGRMLATSDGRVGLVIADGEISKFMMEAVGLHLWEMLQLKIAGDKSIKINCGIADLNVNKGVMEPNIFLLDTEVSQINVTGNIDLGEERLDLTLDSKTKKTSFVSLRPPIYIRGNFAKPAVSFDKGSVAARALGAVALGLVNPLLILVPLVETGPGVDSECGRLIKQVQVPKKR